MCDAQAIIKNLIPDNEIKITEGVFEYSIGTNHGTHGELLPEKVLMMVGATGQGKSTLINRMINYIFGVKYTDEFRYQLVVEKKLSQTESQTRNITKYILVNSLISFKLIVIDTPGIGDTAGKGEDERTIEKIKDLFVSGTIITIDAICFVAKYNEARLTDYIKYVFKTITEIFGKDTKNNIFVMATASDAFYNKQKKIKDPPVLKTFKKADIPCTKCYSFNNKDIYRKPETDEHMLGLECAIWETSTISFDGFFQQLDKTIPVSLHLSKEILQKKHNIQHAQLPYLVRRLKDSIHKIDEYEQDLKGVEKQLQVTEDCTYEVKVLKKVRVPIVKPNIFSTECEKCRQVCHYPCNIQEDCDLHWCTPMSWFNFQFRIYCTVCPKQCSYKDHKRNRTKPEFRYCNETRTKVDLKQKYLQKEGERDDLIKSIEDVMVSAYGDMLKNLEKIQEYIDFIKNQCLAINPTTLEKYIHRITEEERDKKEDGYEKRIHVLDNLTTRMKAMNTQNTTIFEAFKQASSKEKLQQAKQCYNS